MLMLELLGSELEEWHTKMPRVLSVGIVLLVCNFLSLEKQTTSPLEGGQFLS